MKYEFSDKKQLATGNNQPTSLAIVVGNKRNKQHKQQQEEDGCYC
jgi:hypothetical protein